MPNLKLSQYPVVTPTGSDHVPGIQGGQNKRFTIQSILDLFSGGGAGTGNVVGPASATDSNFASFDTTTGKLIKDSGSKASDFATALGADDNYVTDAEKVVIGTLEPIGSALQIVRVNAGGTSLEYADPAAGAGDMVLASAQTNSGAKTFLATTLLLRNVANTFSGLFTNTITAARTWTLQDRNGTLADDTDLALKADATLSNLGTVAINTSLVSDTDNTDDLGTTLKKWANLFVTTIGATATRVTKGWFTDIESTNMPTVGGTAILSSLTAPQFTTIELGHASDTTLSRVSAGKIAVEGVNQGTEGILQNSQSAAYTTVIADAGKHIYHPSADTTARTWTIDSNANVAYPIGTAITFVNDTSGGVITIAITSDTLVLTGAGTTGSRTLAANGVATAIKVTSTRWMISGTGLT